jgi:hypothetical protein
MLTKARISSVSSLRGHVSALSNFFKFSASPDITQHYLVRLAMRGAKRQLGTAPRRKRPLSPGLLMRIRRRVDRRCNRSVACWAAVVCGWWGMLRRSSLLPRILAEPPVLHRSCISQYASGVLLETSYSKTNQFRGRKHSVLLPKLASGHPLCPVTALAEHLRLNRVFRAGDSLFSFLENGRREALTGCRLEAMFKAWLSECGVGSEGFSLHSLRRGAATAAARLGLDVKEIQRIGDCRSDAVNCYIEDDRAQLPAALKLAHRLRGDC